MTKQVIKRLTDREHILKRTGMYMGSPTAVEEDLYIFDGQDFKKKNIRYVPALIKMINEIIDNSVDEAIRTKFKFGNKIEVFMEELNFKVIDNGRGIPVIKEADNEYFPKIAWGYARAGSNFENDEERDTIGANGVGSFGTNVLSSYFKGISRDSKKEIICEWKNNADSESYKESIKASKKRGVEIYSEPDFKLFDIKKIRITDIEIIKSRLAMLKLTYPEIKFFLNGEEIEEVSDFDF